PPLGGSTIERGLATLRGVIEQTPPRYSALKIAGRPAYARARAGETFAMQARRVQVDRLEVIETKGNDVRVLVVCSSGTYVRAIARDLGRSIGSAAHLAALRRLAVGALEAAGAVTPDVLRAGGRGDARRPALAAVPAARRRRVPDRLRRPRGDLSSPRSSRGSPLRHARARGPPRRDHRGLRRRADHRLDRPARDGQALHLRTRRGPDGRGGRAQAPPGHESVRRRLPRHADVLLADDQQPGPLPPDLFPVHVPRHRAVRRLLRSLR